MNLFNENTSKRLVYSGIGLLFLGIILFIWNDWSFSAANVIKADKVGQIGDLAGGIVGSLWALAGVILFYSALQEQRKDMATNRKVLETQLQALEKQIEEFELQREELAMTRKVFIEQNSISKLQHFESTFFSLIGLHHEIVNNLDMEKQTDEIDNIVLSQNSKENKLITSRDCFEVWYNEVRIEYNQSSITQETVRISDAYKRVYLKNQSDLSHYFRNLYNIVKFIEIKCDNDKFFYSNLLRAQLSSYELLLLFYNGLSEFGAKKFKPLIEKYHFLQNMPKKPLLNPKKDIKRYNKKAFSKPNFDIEKTKDEQQG